MLLRTAMGSFLFHFCSSSCILSILAGLRAHRQPLREELPDLFSTFSKHLLRDRLWRTEFFQPSGAVCQTRARQEFRLGSGSKSWLRVWAPEKLHFVCRTTDHSGAFPSQHPAHAWVPFRGGVGRAGNLTVSYFHLKSAFVLLCPWLTLQRQAEVVHKGRAATESLASLPPGVGPLSTGFQACAWSPLWKRKSLFISLWCQLWRGNEGEAMEWSPGLASSLLGQTREKRKMGEVTECLGACTCYM